MDSVFQWLSLAFVICCIFSKKVSSDEAVFETNICQGTSAIVGCNRGEVIYIQHAFYGRTDRSICNPTNRVRRCSGESMKIIWDICEGMNECTLTATDSAMNSKKCSSGILDLFHKYIHIEYRCEAPGNSVIGRCSGPWSRWFNTDTPAGEGDFELLRNLPGACSKPMAIEVRLTRGDDYHAGNDVLKIGKGIGVQCEHSWQDGGRCNDYHVRYCCQQKKPTKCSHPGGINNGFVSPRYKKKFDVGQYVTFSCKSGFRFSGEPRLVCQSNFDWSSPKPTCTKEVETATCKAFGDPHYILLDGKERYDFMGKCTYRMSESCKLQKTDDRWFLVETKNEERKNRKKVSYVGNVRVKLRGGEIDVLLDKEGVIMVNGQQVSEVDTDLYSVKPSGNRAVLETKFGLRVAFTGSAVTIQLNKSYRNQVCGICGNFNGVNTDDLTMPSGELTVDFNEFALSHETKPCDLPAPDPLIECSDEQRKKWEEQCFPLIDIEGAFQDCQSTIDGTEYYESCVFDMCATDGDKEDLEEVFGEYVYDCMRTGINMCDWRTKTGASVVRCPSHSSYVGCTSPCTDSCANPTASASCKDLMMVEGCVCDLGYLRDGSKCVKRSECGCIKWGIYLSKDFTFDAPEEGVECVCEGMNQMNCKCKSGYSGDGVHCEKMCSEPMEFTECATCTRTCDDPEASLEPCTENCLPDVHCVCPPHLVQLNKDTLTCLELSNCPPRCKDNPCDQNASCRDVVDDVFCTCNPGFTGDGYTCESECEEPKVFNQCGTSCPATCLDEFRPENIACTADCRRGCFCPPNMVLEDLESNTCVKPSECSKRGLCKAWGDPHYEMFQSSSKYDFMGKCTYVMSETYKLDKTDPKWFAIHTENEVRNNRKRVSYLKNVRILLQGGDINILLEKNGVASINGQSVGEANDPSFVLRRSGNSLVVITQYGLQVTFNGNAVFIKAPAIYKSKVRGLCGDYNGDSSDDLMMQNGMMAEDFNEFGASYQVGDCEETGIPEKLIFTDKEKEKWSKKEFCGAIIDPDGLFIDCNEDLDAQLFFESCVFDMLATEGDLDVFNQNIEFYVTNCRETHPETFPCDWRNRLGLVKVSCPPHSTYSGCASACPDTCFNLSASGRCKLGVVESCVCDDGYVLDGTECVPRSECGCIRDGFYYPKGTLVPDYDTNKNCICFETIGFSCNCMDGFVRDEHRCRKQNCGDRPCSENADCTDTADGARCTCKSGYEGDGFTCDPVCQSPQVYADCRNLCPNDCADPTGDLKGVCANACEPGCDCPPDMILLSGVNRTCVYPSDCSERKCSDGPCTGVNSQCQDADDGFLCTCKPGYIGDGQNCEEMCKHRKVYAECRNTCPDTCSNRHDPDRICLTICISGCDCPPDMVFLNDVDIMSINDDVPCVFPSDCPVTCRDDPCDENANCEDTDDGYTCTCNSGYSSDGEMCKPVCDPPQVFTECATSCPNTCRDPDASKKECFLMCAPDVNCICPSGMVQLSNDNRECVIIDDCPVTCRNEPCDENAECEDIADGYTCTCKPGYVGDGDTCEAICKPPENYAPCKNICPKTCDDPEGDDKPCPLICIEGCDCPDDMVRLDGDTGPCVYPDECPVTCRNDPCDENAVCEDTDDGYTCTCKPGYVGDGDTCEAICKPPENYAQCKNVCPKTCDDPEGDDKPCPLICIEGCDCPDDMVRLDGDTGPCVYPDECPVTCRNEPCDVNAECEDTADGYTCTCKPGYVGDGDMCTPICESPEMYAQCKNVCPKTCDDPEGDDKPCPLICIEGCDCPDDMVRLHGDTGPCVYPDECPVTCRNEPCDENADCEDIDDGFRCFCKSGYVGDGVTCIPLCTPPEIYAPCRDTCPKSCDDPEGEDTPCSKICMEGCDCPNDMVRLDGDTGQCVFPDDCPITCRNQPCDENANCEDTDDGYTCTCKPGYTEDGDKCTPICQAPKIFSECVSACPSKCDDQFDLPPKPCPAICNIGCMCPPDMVLLDEESRECVTPSECPKRGICKAWGDPHYEMFGRSSRYDFMGKCTYVMSQTYNLPESDPKWFAIHVENEVRRNKTRVSYVKNTRILLNMGDIEILLEQDGVAKINGQTVTEASNPTFTLSRSGNSLVVVTCFGVQIKFNGNAVFIKAPEYYKSKVGGLCGDYNDDSSDDLVMLNGETAADFNEFGASYQVGDCDDPEIPESIIVTEKDKEKWSTDEYCGSLIKLDGIFADCNKLMDVQMYFDACIFDLVATDGDEDIFTENMEFFVANCKDNGVLLCDWREKMGIGKFSCPPHSSYDGCAPACVNSCANPNAQDNCGAMTVEACVCDEGYIMDGVNCVEEKQCGCFRNGAYYSMGTILSDYENNKNCICMETIGFICNCMDGFIRDEEKCRRATCKDISCNEFSFCEEGDLGATCTCNFFWDGTKCAGCTPPLEYTECATPCPNTCFDLEAASKGCIAACDSDVNCVCPPDMVQLSPDNRSCVKATECPVHCRNDPCDENADCEDVLEGFICTCKLGFSGNGLMCEAICDPPKIYAHCKNTCPLTCANKDETSIVLCPLECAKGCDCPADMVFLTDENGPCVSPSDCPVYCRDKPCDENADCVDTDTGHVCTCKLGYTGDGNTCEALCLPPKIYAQCKMNCPKTCANKDDSDLISCPRICKEGCDCPGDMVLLTNENGPCVLPSECPESCSASPCHENADCEQVGTTEVMCTCKFGYQGNGRETCESSCEDPKYYTDCASTCPRTCAEEYGFPPQPCGSDCAPDKNCECPPSMVQIDRETDTCVEPSACPKRATCKAWGDPHYVMFGGTSRYDFMGMCTYVMSETYALDKSDLRWFSIQVENEMRHGRKKVSYVKNARMLLDGGKIDIFLEKDFKITVNGEQVLEASTERYRIWVSGSSVIVLTCDGVQLSFNGNAVFIKLPSTYRGQVGGLCGDYNGDSSDDLVMQNGKTADNFNEFAVSYQVGECDIPVPEPLVECTGIMRERWLKECSEMTDPSGTFADCNAAMSQETLNTFVDSCVFDMCATDGDELVFYELLEAFVIDCRTSVPNFCGWRGYYNKYLPSCPPHSLYKCTTACQNTCFERNAESRCSDAVVEDCVCDEGYIREGTQCIPISDCGCTRDGIYYQKGQVLEDSDQHQLCKCEENLFICQCTAGFEFKEGVCKEITCPGIRVYSNCVTKCPSNCRERVRTCTMDCDPDNFCQCPEMHVERSPDDDTCIPIDDCPPDLSCWQKPCPPNSECIDLFGGGFLCECDRGYEKDGDLCKPAKCPGKMVPTTCAPRCPMNCDDLLPLCTPGCDPDKFCRCPTGFAERSSNDDTCIPIANCFTQKRGCPGDLIFTRCASKCPLTCENMSPECTKDCDRENSCACPFDSVLVNADSDICVLPKDCTTKPISCIDKPCDENAVCEDSIEGGFTCRCVDPYIGNGIDCTEVLCSANQVFSRCVSRCPATCRRRKPSCKTDCSPNKFCQCSEGYIARSGSNKTCIPLTDCPKSCRDNPCHPEATCANRRNGYRCTCNRGYIGNGTFCTEVTCPPDKVSTNCASRCPNNCDDLFRSCTRDCDTSNFCECGVGKVERSPEDSTCIHIPSCLTPGRDCPGGRVFTRCAPRCPATCDDRTPRCPRDCDRENFCVCPSNMVQLSETDETCILTENCPPKSCSDDPCGENAFCTDLESGFECKCISGYSGDGITCTEITCPGNRVFSECVTTCPANCVEKVRPCTFDCDFDNFCQCPVNFVERSPDNDTCIQVDDCPVPECPGNKVYTSCATTCPATCDDPNPVCTLDCDTDNFCVCPEGMVHLSSSNDFCIPRDQCPKELGCSDEPCHKNAICRDRPGGYTCRCSVGYIGDGKWCQEVKCPEDKVFSRCVSQCPLNCDQLIRRCTKDCHPDNFCMCPLGQAERSPMDPTCVPIPVCLSPGRGCPGGMIYTTCATKCPATCEDRTPKCTRDCDRKNFCVCPRNMVLLSEDDRTCVFPRDCQKKPDVIRCKDKPCGVNSDCFNKPGGYECVCKPGFVGDGVTCTEMCKSPKIFHSCPTSCPNTCEDPQASSKPCDRKCAADQCVCPEDMVQRSETDKTCVPVADCVATCSPPLIYASCVCGEPVTCQNMDTFTDCGDRCMTMIRCECPPGLVQLSRDENGIPTCIPPSECPEMCKSPKIFSSCPTSCPNTCEDPEASSKPCDRKCAADQCVCPEDMVQISETDKTCVPVADCVVSAVCDPSMVPTDCATPCPATCRESYGYPPIPCTRNCDPNKRCQCPPGMVQPDKRTDKCIDPSECPKRATCKAWGDPHYQMFEGTSIYDFMGMCTYVMSETYGLDKSDPRWFSIQVENEMRHGHVKVSYVKNARLLLDGGKVDILLEKDFKVTVNGRTVTEVANDLYAISFSGKSVVVHTCEGVKLSFNGNAVFIKVPSTYRDQVGGLCGDYNGDPSDDLQMQDGTMAKDFNEFGDSYKVDKCDIPTPLVDECDKEKQAKWNGDNLCGVISNPEGVFAECNSVMDVQAFVDSCLFDMCATDGSDVVFQQMLEAFVADCRDNGISLCGWRKKFDGHSPECPQHSTYQCTSSCQNSCLNPDFASRCRGIQIEDCVCDDGYLREGTLCIPVSDCGCSNDGVYYPKGEGYVDDVNHRKCTCGNEGMTCVCIEGYRLDADVCTPTCSPPLIYASCVCGEPVTCQNMDTFTDCGDRCMTMIRCECPPGLVQLSRDENGIPTCIPPSECPAGCPANSVPSICASKCPNNCDDLTRQCGEECDRDVKCVCAPGFVQRSSVDKTCVENFHCFSPERDCPGNQIYKPCVSDCTATCSDRNPTCDRSCSTTTSCACMEGMVLLRKDRDSCVMPADCPKEMVTCDMPPEVPAHARVISGDGPYHVNSRLTYECNRGYRIMGSDFRLCQQDGHWSGIPPVCEVVTCIRPSDPTNGQILSGAGTMQVDEVIVYDCRSGYTLNGHQQRTCQPNGQWSGSPPVCQQDSGGHIPTACVTPANVSNAYVISGSPPFMMNSQIVYECDSGYRLQGSNTRICQQNGQWSEIPPVCQEVTCRRPNEIAHGFMNSGSGTFPVGDSVTYECNFGYVLVGNNQITCQVNEQWSGPPPRCEQAMP